MTKLPKPPDPARCHSPQKSELSPAFERQPLEIAAQISISSAAASGGMRMVQRRRGKPYDPAGPIHDRRAQDLLRNAEVTVQTVDDPMGLDPGDRIQVMRSLRDDPLARLHARRQIDEAQYQGGRAFQEDFETAERGPRATDPSKEFVDGGRLPEPITEAQRRAVVRLTRAERALGHDGALLAHGVLITRLSLSAIIRARGLQGERWERYFGLRFRECLDRLAVVYGFSTINQIG